MKGLKVDPQGVGGVGEAPVSKGVGGQQVAKLIRKRRLGDGEDGQQGRAGSQGREAGREGPGRCKPSRTWRQKTRQ